MDWIQRQEQSTEVCVCKAFWSQEPDAGVINLPGRDGLKEEHVWEGKSRV